MLTANHRRWPKGSRRYGVDLSIYFIGILVIRVILAYTFVMKMGMGLSGAWLAVLIDQSLRWVLNVIRLRTGKWKYITIR